MLNMWVKNVNNWRVNTGITIGYLDTVNLTELQFYINSWVQSNFSIFISTLLHPTISTPNLLTFNLLNKSFTLNPQHLLLRLINEN